MISLLLASPARVPKRDLQCVAISEWPNRERDTQPSSRPAGQFGPANDGRAFNLSSLKAAALCRSSHLLLREAGLECKGQPSHGAGQAAACEASRRAGLRDATLAAALRIVSSRALLFLGKTVVTAFERSGGVSQPRSVVFSFVCERLPLRLMREGRIRLLPHAAPHAAPHAT
jgi:hypothetical protein